VETADQIIISTVYTFAMPKYVYVQVKGVEKAAKIEADSAEESGSVGSVAFTLTIKSGDQKVGTFKGNAVDGWWIQDE
jgi:hypothetical protein